MTCLTGGPTPCGAATGIPGPPATSSSPTCHARAALTKASPGTPWSTARPMTAAQPGTAHATTHPTRRHPTPPGSHAGSHRHPAQGGPEPTEAFDITAITSHPATAADTSQLAGSRSHRGHHSRQLLPRTPRSRSNDVRYSISLTCRNQHVCHAHIHSRAGILIQALSTSPVTFGNGLSPSLRWKIRSPNRRGEIGRAAVHRLRSECAVLRFSYRTRFLRVPGALSGTVRHGAALPTACMNVASEGQDLPGRRVSGALVSVPG